MIYRVNNNILTRDFDVQMAYFIKKYSIKKNSSKKIKKSSKGYLAKKLKRMIKLKRYYSIGKGKKIRYFDKEHFDKAFRRYWRVWTRKLNYSRFTQYYLSRYDREVYNAGLVHKTSFNSHFLWFWFLYLFNSLNYLLPNIMIKKFVDLSFLLAYNRFFFRFNYLYSTNKFNYLINFDNLSQIYFDSFSYYLDHFFLWFSLDFNPSGFSLYKFFSLKYNKITLNLFFFLNLYRKKHLSDYKLKGLLTRRRKFYKRKWYVCVFRTFSFRVLRKKYIRFKRRLVRLRRKYRYIKRWWRGRVWKVIKYKGPRFYKKKLKMIIR